MRCSIGLRRVPRDRGASPSARAVLRALCMLAAVLVAGWLLPRAQAQAPAQQADAEGRAPVRVLELQGAIGPAGADYVVRGIEDAARKGARLVVLRVDTPGGLDTSMRQIIQAILASSVPVAVYVSPEGARAASAGTYIMYAAHVAAMAPATTLGAATPVAIGLPSPERKPGPGDAGRTPRSEPKAGDGEKGAKDRGSKDEDADRTKDGAGGGARDAKTGRDGAGRDDAAKEGARSPVGPADAMTAKQVHDAAAFIRGLAQLRGRNAEWAERAVREAVSLTASEALRERVIDVIARDIPDLLEQIDGRSVRVGAADLELSTRGLAYETVSPDWRQRLLSVIANPSVALILMMLGFYGLVLEFSSPGFGVGGVVGAICLILALFALQLLPVNYAGLALILLGMALMVAELFAPSFGVLGIGGVIAFVAGGILLFDRDVPGFGVPLVLVFGLAASSAAVVLLGGGMALRARHRPVVSGTEAMIGAAGEVIEVGDGEAWALVGGERWRIERAAGLRPGQRIRVRGVRGLVLDVQADDDPSSRGEA